MFFIVIYHKKLCGIRFVMINIFLIVNCYTCKVTQLTCRYLQFIDILQVGLHLTVRMKVWPKSCELVVPTNIRNQLM